VILNHTVDVPNTVEDLVDILERLALTHGMPAVLQMDSGPERSCRALAQQAEGVVDLAVIPAGEPWRKGYVESFHWRKRDDFLNSTTFPTLLHVRVELTDWHREYNHLRWHSFRGYKTPTEYAGHCADNTTD
jgi:transposase InsO family protein